MLLREWSVIKRKHLYFLPEGGRREGEEERDGMQESGQHEGDTRHELYR